MSCATHACEPGDGGKSDSSSTSETTALRQKTNDIDLPETVQHQLKDLKFEAIALKKAGDREGAKDRLRQMNDLRVKARRAAAAAAALPTVQNEGVSDDIDWESAAGAIDFDSLYKQRKEEKAIVDEFGVDLATVRCFLLRHNLCGSATTWGSFYSRIIIIGFGCSVLLERATVHHSVT